MLQKLTRTYSPFTGPPLAQHVKVGERRSDSLLSVWHDERVETKAEAGATAHTRLGDYASAIQGVSEDGMDGQRIHEALWRTGLVQRVAHEPLSEERSRCQTRASSGHDSSRPSPSLGHRPRAPSFASFPSCVPRSGGVSTTCTTAGL